MYIWGLIEVLCTVDEEDDLCLAFWKYFISSIWYLCFFVEFVKRETSWF